MNPLASDRGVCPACPGLRAGIVIPVYNHGPKLPAVMSAVLRLGLPVVLVDDGSTDGGTEPYADHPGVTRLRFESNRGKGAALRAGLHALQERAEIAVTLDADGQHDPSDVSALLKAADACPKALILGSRAGMMSGRDAPWSSRWGRRFSNFWVRLGGGPRVSDSQSGFRAYPVRETLALRSSADRFDFEVEVLILAAWAGVPVVETPVRVRYDAERVSHFRPFVDFARNGAVFGAALFRRLFTGAASRRRRALGS